PGNEWVPLKQDPKSGRRPWKPKERVPSPKGGQPRPQWSPDEGHWDYDDGLASPRRHFLPDGTEVDHFNNPIGEPGQLMSPIPAPTPQQLMQLLLTGTILRILVGLIVVF